MNDTTNDIDALLRDLTADPYRTVLLSCEECARHHAALTALVAERDALKRRAEDYSESLMRFVSQLNAVIKERDEARRVVCRDESSRRQRIGLVYNITVDSIAAELGWDCFKGGGA